MPESSFLPSVESIILKARSQEQCWLWLPLRNNTNSNGSMHACSYFERMPLQLHTLTTCGTSCTDFIVLCPDRNLTGRLKCFKNKIEVKNSFFDVMLQCHPILFFACNVTMPFVSSVLCTVRMCFNADVNSGTY